MDMAPADWLRAAEFHVPPSVARVFVRMSPGRFNPYRPEDDLLRAIFVHVPKTGGTSVRAGLYGTDTTHVPLSRFLAFDPDRHARYFKFAFVRNPWNRVHSAWRYLSAKVGNVSFPDGRWATEHLSGLDTFERFVRALDDGRRRRTILRWVHFRPQVDWLRIPGRPGHGCDFIGRFESIDEDFRHVCARLGVERRLPFLRASKGGPERSPYTAALADRVGELYAADVATFGYRLE
jgi:hypothetical protein